MVLWEYCPNFGLGLVFETVLKCAMSASVSLIIFFFLYWLQESTDWLKDLNEQNRVVVSINDIDWVYYQNVAVVLWCRRVP